MQGVSASRWRQFWLGISQYYVDFLYCIKNRTLLAAWEAVIHIVKTSSLQLMTFLLVSVEIPCTSFCFFAAFWPRLNLIGPARSKCLGACILEYVGPCWWGLKYSWPDNALPTGRWFSRGLKRRSEKMRFSLFLVAASKVDHARTILHYRILRTKMWI